MEELELKGVIGSSAKRSGTWHLLPGDAKTLVYPLGCAVTLRNTGTGRQTFLARHSHEASRATCALQGWLLGSCRAGGRSNSRDCWLGPR
jgi:hypothetical protein